MAVCFVCGKPTLGLDGIEARLDTYMLNGESSQGVLNSGEFGDCHLSCLVRHTSGATWAQALQRHFEQNLRFQLLEKQEAVTVLRGGRPEQYAVLWSDGAHYMLSPAEYKEAFLQHRPVARHRRQRIAVNAGSDFNLWFCEALRKSDGVSLRETYGKLGVPSHVATNLDGTIKASPKEPYATSADGGFDGELEVTYSFETASLK